MSKLPAGSRPLSALFPGIVSISLALFYLASPIARAVTTAKALTFDRPVSSFEWTLAEINPDLPADWTGFDFLVVEFKASSSQRFELGLKTADQHVSKRIHPLAGVWVRASIPLRFFRQGLGDAHDLAATVNQPRDSYWINIESGGHGPTTAVRGMTVVMRYPVGYPTLEIRSITLAKTDPGDAVLGGKPVLDEFGQYAHVEWPGKAHSDADLKKAWADEAAGLEKAGTFPGHCPYGGFLNTKANATGFFRVEKIAGRWWFICPDGHQFYSTGVNGIGPGSGTRTAGREDYFAKIPPPAPAAGGAPPQRGAPQASFYTANVQNRYGADWRKPWAELTARRLSSWGINTSYGPALNEALGTHPSNKPYVFTLRGWQTDQTVMGMPDVYSEEFSKRVDAAAERLLAPRKEDPLMVGYFIGNEPPWPGRESQLVDEFLAKGPSETAKHFRTELAKGDTPERRKQLVLAAFERYLATINAAVKKHDPNHLNLGIRFGGTPPDDVIKLARGFDVYSLNKYRYAVPTEMLNHVHTLVDLPLLIGEFHIGVPGRGLAPGLVQAMNQEERGLAYRYYVEHAAAHPAVVGTHWFQWIDQPATGRNDGENYNIGWIDVTDRPYAELVDAAKITHARLLDLHSGKVPPTNRNPKTSDVGTTLDSSQLGRVGVQ
ncbi:MAG TPA: hypothetical protein VHO24_03680 [Opitutaceae bacterium]|nr:hypothetical protein [Opitutaceae bacterium]